MSWLEAFQVGAAILVSVGGAGAIVLGLSGFLGNLIAARLVEGQRRQTETALATLRGRLDEGLARLDATLEHQNFLLQRLADVELQGVHACWKSAIHSFHLVNGLRPVDCGTDKAALDKRLAELSSAHNQLLSVTGEYDPFLVEAMRALLHDVTQTVRLELSQASHDIFTSHWWDQGTVNREHLENQIDGLRAAVQLRVAQLRRLAEQPR